jgi:hypothetical protein
MQMMQMHIRPEPASKHRMKKKQICLPNAVLQLRKGNLVNYATKKRLLCPRWTPKCLTLRKKKVKANKPRLHE